MNMPILQRALGALATLSTLALSGCASTDTTDSATRQVRDDEYVTGSRLPRRPAAPANVKVITRDELEVGGVPSSGAPGSSGGGSK